MEKDGCQEHQWICVVLASSHINNNGGRMQKNKEKKFMSLSYKKIMTNLN